MPQLSPMVGFVMFLTILVLLFTFMASVSKKSAKVNQSKMKTLKKPSFVIFKLWNGSKMPKL